MRASSTNLSGEDVQFIYLRTVFRNAARFLCNPVSLLGAVLILWLTIRLVRRMKNGTAPDIPRMVPLGIVALYPFAWFLFAKNHSYIHGFLVSKTLVVPMTALLLMLTDRELEGKLSVKCAAAVEKAGRRRT